MFTKILENNCLNSISNHFKSQFLFVLVLWFNNFKTDVVSIKCMMSTMYIAMFFWLHLTRINWISKIKQCCVFLCVFFSNRSFCGFTFINVFCFQTNFCRLMLLRIFHYLVIALRIGRFNLFSMGILILFFFFVLFCYDEIVFF